MTFEEEDINQESTAIRWMVSLSLSSLISIEKQFDDLGQISGTKEYLMPVSCMNVLPWMCPSYFIVQGSGFFSLSFSDECKIEELFVISICTLLLSLSLTHTHSFSAFSLF